MNDLIQQVQAASTAQPDWLREKRQLAAMLLAHFSTSETDNEWVSAWQKKPQLNWLDEPLEGASDHGLYNQPLNVADKKYPALCQENWMEKGLFWQDSQINALHLALLNGGRLIYLPDNTDIEQPLQLRGELAASNYHTLVIAGAGSHLQINDGRYFISPQPLMAGVEVLLGTGATVTYQWNANMHSAANYMALGFYQAQQSNFAVKITGNNGHQSTIALHGDLDGDDSKGVIDVGPLDEKTHLDSFIDSHGPQKCERQLAQLDSGHSLHINAQYGQNIISK